MLLPKKCSSESATGAPQQTSSDEERTLCSTTDSSPAVSESSATCRRLAAGTHSTDERAGSIEMKAGSIEMKAGSIAADKRNVWAQNTSTASYERDDTTGRASSVGDPTEFWRDDIRSGSGDVSLTQRLSSLLSFAITARDVDFLDDECSIFSIDTDDLEEAHGGELAQRDVDDRYNSQLRRARRMSYFAFFCTTVQGLAAISLGVKYEMISLTAMGAQICIDLLSSVMVVWRFYTRSASRRQNPRHADAEYKLKEALRERRAALGVGVLLMATSVWAASWSFVNAFGVPAPPEQRAKQALITLSVAWPGFVLSATFAVMKWTAALRLRSRVLQKDAVCPTFGAALSFITAVFASIDYYVLSSGGQANTGGADSVAALIMSALLMAEGFRTIYQNTVGWVPPSGVTNEMVDQYYHGAARRQNLYRMESIQKAF